MPSPCLWFCNTTDTEDLMKICIHLFQVFRKQGFTLPIDVLALADTGCGAQLRCKWEEKEEWLPLWSHSCLYLDLLSPVSDWSVMIYCNLTFRYYILIVFIGEPSETCRADDWLLSCVEATLAPLVHAHIWPWIPVSSHRCSRPDEGQGPE